MFNLKTFLQETKNKGTKNPESAESRKINQIK
jgi:hypothetical protein